VPLRASGSLVVEYVPPPGSGHSIERVPRVTSNVPATGSIVPEYVPPGEAQVLRRDAVEDELHPPVAAHVDVGDGGGRGEATEADGDSRRHHEHPSYQRRGRHRGIPLSGDR
jgi:hypothetical protein